MELVKQVSEIAREKGIKISNLVLAWTLAQGEDIIPIPGTKRVVYLEENLEALNVTLSPEDLARIEQAMPAEKVSGDRYPPGQMAIIQR